MWIWLACTPQPLRPLAEATTDDGAWRVALPDHPWPEGPAALAVAVASIDDLAPAEGLAVEVRTRMPDMAHENEVLVAREEDAGSYAVEAWFSMPGLWIIAVDAEGSVAELVVSVE